MAEDCLKNYNEVNKWSLHSIRYFTHIQVIKTATSYLRLLPLIREQPLEPLMAVFEIFGLFLEQIDVVFDVSVFVVDFILESLPFLQVLHRFCVNLSAFPYSGGRKVIALISHSVFIFFQ